MKKFFWIGLVLLLAFFALLFVFQNDTLEKYTPTHPLEIAGYKKIGVVKSYDRSNGYYAGGEPPKNTGVCSDVVIRALRENGFDLQTKVFEDIKNFPEFYNEVPDRNISHRRVRNLRVFFERHFESIDAQNFEEWQPGDIVTYEKIPNGLWHIGIVSGEKDKNGIPMLLDNHGYGTSVRINITEWPARISGHFRVPDEIIYHEPLRK
jgi:uncharacterized protein YijF (DUF1287 family)